MTQRRNVRKPTKARAPKDALSPGEAPPAALSRTPWQWALLGIKVTVGASLLAASVATLAWGVHRYAQTTPRFSIVELEVEGTKRLSREDVLGAAAVTRGANLFSLDIPQAERKLVESPWISSARVTRRLPGTVRIQVVEREPRAIAILSGKSFLISTDGTPFKELGQGDPHDFPVITGISIDALRRDRRAEVERLARAVGLVRQYEESSLAQAQPVQEVPLADSGAVSLLVGESGTTLHLGRPPFKQKLLRAERVLLRAAREGGAPRVVFLDNEAHPERVVVRVQ
jgi:cell division protein FtsQ